VPSSLVEGYFYPHPRGNSVPEFSGIGFGIMPTILLEHKRTGNVVGESHESFFDFSIKWENLVLFGFGGWSQLIQQIDGVKFASDSCFSKGIIFPVEREAFPKKKLKAGDRTSGLPR